MNTQTRMIIGVLGALVVALAVTLGVVIAMDDDDGAMAGRSHMDADDSYAGMMQSMSDLDSDAMLDYMRDVLGADGYQRMMDHLSDHRTGGPMTGDPDVDQMMHRMMDGMMQHMPADADNIMPPGRDEHHETPAANNTPTP
jgi:hypothetical protein